MIFFDTRDRHEADCHIQNSRDLCDFCEKWPSNRKGIVRYLEALPSSGGSEKENLFWFVELADRVCATEFLDENEE